MTTEIDKQPVQEDQPVRVVEPLIAKATPHIEQLPAGLYFKIEGKDPVCMFSDGRDIITVVLDRESARFIGEWLVENA